MWPVVKDQVSADTDNVLWHSAWLTSHLHLLQKKAVEKKSERYAKIRVLDIVPGKAPHF